MLYAHCPPFADGGMTFPTDSASPTATLTMTATKSSPKGECCLPAEAVSARLLWENCVAQPNSGQVPANKHCPCLIPEWYPGLVSCPLSSRSWRKVSKRNGFLCIFEEVKTKTPLRGSGLIRAHTDPVYPCERSAAKLSCKSRDSDSPAARRGVPSPPSAFHLPLPLPPPCDARPRRLEG